MKNYLQRKNEGDIFDVFDDFFRPMFYEEQRALRTDIKETDKEYMMDIEVPGYGKDQIKISLDDGYLTINCAKEEKEENGKYLRKEITSSCQRSYFVGHNVSQEDIHAKYDNGILTLTVPKESPKPQKNNFIAIE